MDNCSKSNLSLLLLIPWGDCNSLEFCFGRLKQIRFLKQKTELPPLVFVEVGLLIESSSSIVAKNLSDSSILILCVDGFLSSVSLNGAWHCNSFWRVSSILSSAEQLLFGLKMVEQFIRTDNRSDPSVDLNRRELFVNSCDFVEWTTSWFDDLMTSVDNWWFCRWPTFLVSKEKFLFLDVCRQLKAVASVVISSSDGSRLVDVPMKRFVNLKHNKTVYLVTSYRQTQRNIGFNQKMKSNKSSYIKS